MAASPYSAKLERTSVISEPAATSAASTLVPYSETGTS